MRSTLVLGFVLALVFLAYVLPAQLRPSHFPADDSYFYLQIAHNIAAGYGSTFNRITPTNGYHPLWMLLCVIAAVVAKGDKIALMHYTFAIQVLLFLGIGYLLALIGRSVGLRYWWVGLPIAAGYFLTGLYGSEAHLSGLAVLLCLYLLFRRSGPRSLTGALAVGFATGVAVLARLDNVFFAGVVWIALALQIRHQGGSWYSLRSIAAPVASTLVVAPYLAWNFAAFGHLMPISGAIKSTFPVVIGHIGNLGGLGKVSSAVAISGLALAGLAPKYQRWRSLLVIMAASVLLHAAYVVVFTDHVTLWSWYYVLGVLNLCLVVAAVLGSIPTSLTARAHDIAVIATVALAILGVMRAWQRYQDPDRAGGLSIPARGSGARERWPYDVSRWLDTNLPPGSGVLVYDYPGMIAYFSHLRILPADGLVCDFRYNDDILRQGIVNYAREKGIGYYLGRVDGATGSVRIVDIMAPVYRRVAGSLVLPRSSIVATGHVFSTNPTLPPLALWRLPRS